MSEDLLGELEQKYQNIDWAVYSVDQETEEMFGKGFMLRGRKGDREKELLILRSMEWNEVLEWAGVIARYLNS